MKKEESKEKSNEELYFSIVKQGGYIKLDKVALKLTAFNIEKTINAISTNEIKKSKNGFVDLYGKIVALVDQKVIDKDTMFLLIEKSVFESFLKHCEKYFKLGRIKVEQLDLEAFHLIGTTQIIGDFRFSQPIGYITLLSNERKIALQSLLQIPAQMYDVIRLENNISVQGIDFTNQMFLETNWEDLAVSYTKGCYLGQEVLARVHNLGKPARRLVRVISDKELDHNITRYGEQLGKITTKGYSFRLKKHLAFAIINGYEQKTVDDGEII